VNCERAQAALSARMDGEHLSAHMTSAVEGHLATCAACQAFEHGAWKLREAARFEVVPAVPDLVDPIMAAVRSEPRRVGLLAPRPARRGIERAPLFPRLARSLVPVAAALAVGLVVGSLAVGGPWRRPGGAAPIAAADVPRQVLAAAQRLDSYQARFAVTEYHFAPDVPVRELSMNVWFEAPERFRLDVTDHTQYPSDLFTPTDLELVVDGSTWYSVGPSACPTASCPPKEAVVTNRVPFSASAPAPTDLVLPVTTLADANQLEVIGRGTVLGREAIKVQVPFERAEPLFPFLSLGGSWRPFFANDRVVLWLDAKSFFPLQYEVYPAAGHERDQWALRFGLPDEPSRRAIFQVTAISVSEQAPPAGTFEVPRTKRPQDQGAKVVPLDQVPQEAGFEPVTPQQVDGLHLYQVTVQSTSDPKTKPDQTLLTYSKGLTWLKVGETRDWQSDTFYGPVGQHAAEVPLANGGVAYYEPATDEHGRRLAIHAAGTDLYLETNLSRDELISFASSVPVTGITIPEAWALRESPEGMTERVSLEEVTGRLPFALSLPTTLPPGFGLASAELVSLEGSTGLNVYFQQEDTDLGSGLIRLHLEAGTELPPASSASQSAVEVRGVEGRWTPDRNQLEWVESGVYYSLDAPGLELPDLLAVAETIAPVPAPSGSPPPSPVASPSPPAPTP
jgi:outer membrane lipoprotein-sorting protein